MKITFRQASEAEASLDSLEKQKIKDVKLAYAISKNVDVIRPVLRALAKARTALVLEYGEADFDDGGKEVNFFVRPNTRQAVKFGEVFDEKLDEEVPDDLKVRRFTLDQLVEAGLELTVGDFANLGFMITDPEEGS